MRYWASIAAGTALAGCAVAAPPARSVATSGTLRIAIAGRQAGVKVAIAPAEIDPANDHVVTPLGQRGAFLLLTDSYASRAQGLSRCEAGHETWVRLIDTRARTERWSKRAESCLHDIEPGDPVASWAARGTAFTVNLLSEPGVHVSIDPRGRIFTRTR